MNVKIKKLSDKAVIPAYAHVTDAGMDIVATRKWTDKYGNICYGTDLAFELPEGYVMLIFPRSSVSKYDLTLANSVGVLDCGYHGELIFKFKPALAVSEIGNPESDPEDETWDLDDEEIGISIPGITPYINPNAYYIENKVYEVGDRIGQIIILPYPSIEFEEVEEFSESERGTGGFGSTGK